MYRVPHRKGVVGVAAQMVYHIAERMKCEGWRPKRAKTVAMAGA